jgi:hypothetical protein
MRVRAAVVVVVMFVLLSIQAFAQSAPPATQAVTAPALVPSSAPAPTLTDVQKLQIQNIAQRIEIAQLRAQQAQRDFDAANADAQKLIAALQVPGYTLDLQTLTYTKAPAGQPTPDTAPAPPKKEQ